MVKSGNSPTISILTYVYNGGKTIKNCIESVLSQDYPLKNIEWIIVGGGSTDGSREIVKEYEKKYPKNIVFYESPTEHKYAGNEGYNMFARKVSKDLILFIDQEDQLIGKDWLNEMVKIFVENEKISAVQSRWFSPKKGKTMDKYLGALGVNDPFAIPYSLNSQIVLNPKQFRCNKEGDYYIHKTNTRNFLYAGEGGFMIRKDCLFESGGWIQDTDLFYRMGMNHYNIAIPNKLRIYKKKEISLKKFLLDRGFKVQFYLSQNYDGRDFYWFDFEKNSFKQNLKFVSNVLKNFLFIPNLFQGIKMALKKKQSFWLVHPFILFSLTMSYSLVKLRALFEKEEKF